MDSFSFYRNKSWEKSKRHCSLGKISSDLYMVMQVFFILFLFFSFLADPKKGSCYSSLMERSWTAHRVYQIGLSKQKRKWLVLKEKTKIKAEKETSLLFLTHDFACEATKSPYQWMLKRGWGEIQETFRGSGEMGVWLFCLFSFSWLYTWAVMHGLIQLVKFVCFLDINISIALFPPAIII